MPHGIAGRPELAQLVPVRIYFGFAQGEARPAVGISDVSIDTHQPPGRVWQ
jgi:hypothetical protein